MKTRKERMKDKDNARRASKKARHILALEAQLIDLIARVVVLEEKGNN